MRKGELLLVLLHARVAEAGRDLALESTFYRALHAADQKRRRARSQPSRTVKAPTTGSHRYQVWSWGVIYLPTAVRGQYFYLYLIEGIYSRKAVGREVHEQESGELGAQLLRSVLSEQCLLRPSVLNSDNGAPLQSATMLQKMYDLGVTPSHSRPRVRDFIRWYNHEHRHSRIGFVTPAERHRGENHAVLARRYGLYQEARNRMPERWSGATRNWTPTGAVAFNPEREQESTAPPQPCSQKSPSSWPGLFWVNRPTYSDPPFHSQCPARRSHAFQGPPPVGSASAFWPHRRCHCGSSP